MNKDEHLIRFKRFQQSREKHFAPLINEALQNQYKIVIDHILEGKSAVQRINSEGIMKVIRNLYMDAGIIYGAKIRADLNKEGAYKTELKNRRPIGFSERMAQLIADYFRTDILNTSEGITQTTRELITEVFTNAYKDGLGIDDIISQLKDTELSRVRSRLIARTETVTSANKGAMFVAKDSGLLLQKVWLSAHDSRTRNHHKHADGQTVGRDDYFKVGGVTMLHPGARKQENGLPVPPDEVINCRCTTLFKSVRDSNGRLIRA